MPTPVRTLHGRFYRPELAHDYQLTDIEDANPSLPVLRTLICLWMYADRSGRFEWDARKMRYSILPHRDLQVLRDTLEVLRKERYLCRYDAQGKPDENGQFGHVRTWDKYQIPNKRERASVLPVCPCGNDVEVAPERETTAPKKPARTEANDKVKPAAGTQLGTPHPDCLDCEGSGVVVVAGNMTVCECRKAA
jgi:hypothetical protein